MKKHHKRAGKRTARRHNTSASAPARKPRRWHSKRATRHNPGSAPRGFSQKVNAGNIIQILKASAAVGLGTLANSFAERQAERLLPELNSVLRTIGTTVLVAGVAIYFGGKTFGKDFAAGVISDGARGLAKALMPGMFSGGEEELEVVSGAEGYWDERNQWAPLAGGDISGLAYTLSDPAPMLAVRPAGF